MDWLSYFRKWASKYEREVEAYGYCPEKLIKPFLPIIGKRKRCLDVGCGTGKSLEVVSKFCKEVIGVEPVEKMAKRAEKKGFKVLRVKGEEISEIEGKFDLITFFASIDYMNAKKVAEGVREKIERDGFVFITVEPENYKKILETFEKFGFKVVKKLEKRAYERQNYICLLLKLP